MTALKNGLNIIKLGMICPS